MIKIPSNDGKAVVAPFPLLFGECGLQFNSWVNGRELQKGYAHIMHAPFKLGVYLDGKHKKQQQDAGYPGCFAFHYLKKILFKVTDNTSWGGLQMLCKRLILCKFQAMF